MKEFEFKDLPGKSETNTFFNYDIFEIRRSSESIAVHRAFDLTDPYTDEDFGRQFPAGIGGTGHFWVNLVNERVSNSAGGGGALLPIVKDSGIITKQEYSVSSKEITSDGESLCPYFNENTLLYANQMVSSLDPGISRIRVFRSGYLEFTFKTNKKNSIIAYGNTDAWVSVSAASLTQQKLRVDEAVPNEPVVINKDYAYIQEQDTNKKTFKVNLKDGKINLQYNDNVISHEDDFELTGNLDIADDKWHHVVINIGRPGTLRERGQKFNKQFIEIWIDGVLDFRTSDYINNKNIFFPMLEWMLMNPIDALQKQNIIENGWNTADARDREFSFSTTSNIGLDEFGSLFDGIFNQNAIASSFKGSIHTIVFGLNYCLNKFEIQQRLRLWRGFEKNLAPVFNVSAEMVTPTVTANKKKALKLFWNTLINEKSKNGLELDDTFVVDSYSITHKIKNSKTETNNVDVAAPKTLKYLTDVKVVMTSNVILWGPGVDTYYNDSSVTGNLRFFGSVKEVRQLNPININYEPGGSEYDFIDSIYNPEYNPTGSNKFTSYAYENLLLSGIKLNSGDRILLTNQFNKKDNGIYVFSSLSSPLIRATDASSGAQIENAVVRVIDGKYKDTSWTLEKNIESFREDQNWIQLEYHPRENDLNSQPIFTSRWSNQNGTDRFINLEEDLDISEYDVITFMNYPETSEEIKENILGYSDFEIKVIYDNFIKSLQNVVAQGASLFVSSPKLATDLGIVKKFTEVPQLLETSDAQSAAITPFEINESADKYFDTHRNNQYHLMTEIAGLTNKSTYILTDFINYNPDNLYEYEQYHAKYAYRPQGIKEGNTFIIPGTTLRKVTENDKLPGFNQNSRGTKPLLTVIPSDIITGTSVTKLSNTYYAGSVVTNNPYDDNVTTIIVQNGHLLNGQPVTGKIFVNCVEDGYTFSRQEYNKAFIQVLPVVDSSETTATRAWQYSTTRLNRLPQINNIRELTRFGQTTPTNSGGGPFIQAVTNSSSGIIRSKTDKGNVNYESDLYPTIDEEIYELQEIPVLSMTWLGLQWLAE